MRPQSIRLMIVVLILLAAAGMTVAAGQYPAQHDLTITAPPLSRASEMTATPTPPPVRPAGPPTVIQPNRIYEGNYFGTPVEYKLNAELGQFFALDVTTDDFDAVIEINDASGTQVARDDDGGPGNMPYLLFVAPETSEFTVIVRGFSDPVEGSYVLRASTAIARLPIGETISVSIDGENSTIYAFEAESGDVVNIVANSGDTVDTTLRLIGPGNGEIGYVDDYAGVDPEFQRLPLSESGTYFLIHAPYSTGAVGEVTLSIERTELITLGADPQAFSIQQSQNREIFDIDVEAGQVYLVTLSSPGEVSGSMDVTDLDAESNGSVSFTSVEGASLFFRAGMSGSYRLNVTVYNSTGEPKTQIFLSVRSTGD